MSKTQGPYKLWLYQARRVLTQDNAGGGALQVKISLGSGQVGRVTSAVINGPASNTTLAATKRDEDGNSHQLIGLIGAGVSNTMNLPGVGGNSGATSNTVTNTQEIIIGPGQYLQFDAAAALQTETMIVAIDILLSTPATPTWDASGSAGTPNLAASTISATNTMQALLEPRTGL